jgi:hypothetical protein
MSLTVTLILLAAFVALFAYGSWKSAKPADPLRPRMVPWRPVMVAAGLGGILMLVHVLNLMGVETGRH